MAWIYLIVSLIVFFLIVMLIDTHRFVTRKYSIHNTVSDNTFSFVFLSDLHGVSFGKGNQRLLNAIDRLHPEAVLIGGDMITAKNGVDFSETIAFLETLAKKYPVYYGVGNHEYRMAIYPDAFGDMYSDFTKELRKIGIHLMMNETAQGKEGFVISGSAIDRRYYKKVKCPRMEEGYMESILGKKEEDGKFHILLAHNPQYYDAYDSWGANLVLAGHVHGGLMRLPIFGGVISPTFRLFPQYDGGIFQKEKSVMVLSRGLGYHTLPIRIFNPGELIFIEIK